MKKRNHFNRIQKKQYNTNQYRNPYFKKTRKVPIMPIAILAGVLLLAGITFSFVYGWSGFKIKTVHVSGINHISAEDFQNKTTSYLTTPRRLFFSNRNKFLFDETELRSHLEQHFAFESFSSSIKKNHLEIEIAERTSKLLWKSDKKLYLVDLGGVLVREISKDELAEQGSEFSIFPIFVDRNNVKVSIGDHVMNEQEILNTFKFQKRLATLGIGFQETQIDRLAGKWTSVITDQGYDILFDFSADVDAQAGRLDVLFRDTVKDTSKLKYIDLRFGDHVYYR